MRTRGLIRRLLLCFLVGAVMNLGLAWLHTYLISQPDVGERSAFVGCALDDGTTWIVGRFWDVPGVVSVTSQRVADARLRRRMSDLSDEENAARRARAEELLPHWAPRTIITAGTLTARRGTAVEMVEGAQARGLPLLSFRCVYGPVTRPRTWAGHQDRTNCYGAVRVGGCDLPFLPIWPGFLINSVLFGAIVLAFWGFVRMIVRAARREDGLCPSCGYDLASGKLDSCPECGWNRTSDEGDA
ncbi:MAG: hypothetical protein KAS72_01840 [Phycisphaerales bacterium]|nr:hypothetical protein [Phycisphaerales bacterium]